MIPRRLMNMTQLNLERRKRKVHKQNIVEHKKVKSESPIPAKKDLLQTQTTEFQVKNERRRKRKNQREDLAQFLVVVIVIETMKKDRETFVATTTNRMKKVINIEKNPGIINPMTIMDLRITNDINKV